MSCNYAAKPKNLFEIIITTFLLGVTPFYLVGAHTVGDI
jgi:hypothetical protein